MNKQAAARMFRVRDMSGSTEPLGTSITSSAHSLRDLFTGLAFKAKDAVFTPNAETMDNRVMAAVDNDLPWTAQVASRGSSLTVNQRSTFRMVTNQLLDVKADTVPDPGAERAARRKMQELTDIIRTKRGVPAFFKQGT